MDITEYYNIARKLAVALEQNNQVDVARKLNEALDNKNDESPALWIPKIKTIITTLYQMNVVTNYSNELYEIIDANAKLEHTGKLTMTLIMFVLIFVIGVLFGVVLCKGT